MGVNNLIQIGNSDDRLTQSQWADLIGDLRGLLTVEWRGRLQIHGEWFSAPDRPWQNANWCVEILPPAWWRAAGPDGLQKTTTASMAPAEVMRDSDTEKARGRLKEQVQALCLRYSQDSFAWTTGIVELVETGWVEPTASDRWREWAAKTVDREFNQAQREGWLLPTEQEVKEGIRSPYLNEGDYRRITRVLECDRQEPTPGTDGDSTPPAPASTGAGGPWARTEGELRGHDHTGPASCPVVDCIHSNPFGKAAG